MSPRPLRLRKISNPPIISGFKPYGFKNSHRGSEIIFLQFEEYEALRLCDHEMLNHCQASAIMNVSRPTLTRGCFFSNPEKQVRIVECPLCSSPDIENYKDYMTDNDDFVLSCNNLCICPECGHEQPHRQGTPCNAEICPECGRHMVRKGTSHGKKPLKNNRYESSDNKHGKQSGK